jgi:hypothetical protein
MNYTIKIKIKIKKMTAKDYIPRRDANFNILQGNVYVNVSENAEAWQILPMHIEAIEKQRRRWNEAYAASCDPAKRTKGVVKEKDDARKAYESVLRVFIQGQIMHNPKVSDFDRLSMGLPVYDRTPTPARPPATRPEIEVDFSQIARHVLHVRDSRTKSAGKPPHVVGFEIWRYIGKTLPSLDEMFYIELAIHSPHLLVYSSAERAQTVWYAVRWVSRRGEKGPWSEPVPAIIT